MPARASHRRLPVWVPALVALLVQLGTTWGALGLHAPQRWGAYAGPSCSFGPAGVATQCPSFSSGPVWFPLALLAVACAGPLLLLGIRSAPAPMLGLITVVALGGVALAASARHTPPFYLSVLFAAAFAVFRGYRWAWAWLGAYWLAVVGSYALTRNPAGFAWIVPFTVLSVAAIGGPSFARNRRLERERLRASAEARRVEEAQAERVRIARELHDVLAHSLSQINVQASVGLHLFGSQPAKAEEALASIKDVSKSALAEVRQVLGMLRGDETDAAPLAPEPDLSRLPELAEGLRASGLDVVLRVELPHPAIVPRPVQQATYRIVQESITNVTRHAHASHVEVAVAAADGAIRISVVDDGVGADSAPGEDGRGLLGMRERAELLGGSFHAGPRAGGGFEVSAALPFGGAS
ncbi:MAG TPA: sensor histidine kinase [Gryllotalpicola sp.]